MVIFYLVFNIEKFNLKKNVRAFKLTVGNSSNLGYIYPPTNCSIRNGVALHMCPVGSEVEQDIMCTPKERAV